MIVSSRICGKVRKNTILFGTLVHHTIVGRIESRDFTMGERPHRLCKGCDMKPYCDAK